MRHGTIEYAVDYLGRDGARRGQEFCTLTTHADGRRTLRARSEIFDAEVLRDVIYTVDAGFRPIDALIRVSVEDRTVGAALFAFGEDCATCENVTAAEGRGSQRMVLAGRAQSFLTHAMAADVWHGAEIQKTAAAGVQQLPSILSSSPLHDWASGPVLGRWPLQAQFIGTETIGTPAGRFAAEHIRYEEPNGEMVLDTWCTADEHRIMLRMHYPVQGSSYLLAGIR